MKGFGTPGEFELCYSEPAHRSQLLRNRIPITGSHMFESYIVFVFLNRWFSNGNG